MTCKRTRGPKDLVVKPATANPRCKAPAHAGKQRDVLRCSVGLRVRSKIPDLEGSLPEFQHARCQTQPAAAKGNDGDLLGLGGSSGPRNNALCLVVMSVRTMQVRTAWLVSGVKSTSEVGPVGTYTEGMCMLGSMYACYVPAMGEGSRCQVSRSCGLI